VNLILRRGTYDFWNFVHKIIRKLATVAKKKKLYEQCRRLAIIADSPFFRLPSTRCVFITAGPSTKLFTCGGGGEDMARRRRRQRPAGLTTAVGSGGRRAPISTDTASHTHTVYPITFGSGKQLFPGLIATGINSVS
jgi:hypothetical protein